MYVLTVIQTARTMLFLYSVVNASGTNVVKGVWHLGDAKSYT